MSGKTGILQTYPLPITTPAPPQTLSGGFRLSWCGEATAKPASDFTGGNGGNRGNAFPADHADERGWGAQTNPRNLVLQEAAEEAEIWILPPIAGRIQNIEQKVTKRTKRVNCDENWSSLPSFSSLCFLL
jgi:hypothetical protein